MPEAPQMQALAERLAEAAQGKVLQKVDPLQNFAALKTFDPDPMSLRGRQLVGTGRRGKFLILDFGDGLRVLVHLSQGGRVDVEVPPKATKPKGAVVRFAFDDVAFLVKEFGTERKAGWWVLGPGDDGPLDNLGPEALSDEFAEWIRTSDDGRRVHTILRHQGSVAGVGRGYTDDILHHAKLSPYASLKSLSAEQRERLVASIHEILAQGLKKERQRTGGLPNKLGDGWIVHKGNGQPCPTCGDTLHHVSYESHEVVYCPACQTGGKILADRRLSRLLK